MFRMTILNPSPACNGGEGGHLGLTSLHSSFHGIQLGWCSCRDLNSGLLQLRQSLMADLGRALWMILRLGTMLSRLEGWKVPTRTGLDRAGQDGTGWDRVNQCCLVSSWCPDRLGLRSLVGFAGVSRRGLEGMTVKTRREDQSSREINARSDWVVGGVGRWDNGRDWMVGVGWY